MQLPQRAATFVATAMPGITPIAAPAGNLASSVILASTPQQQPLQVAPNLLQSLQEPLPQKSLESNFVLQSPGSSTSQAPHPPQVNTQMSLDTANADAEISQLLETLQKNPESLAIETEKMADFIKTLQNENETNLDQQPLTVATTLQSSTTSSKEVVLLSPKKEPVTLSTSSSATSTQPSVIAKPELTAGTTGFQASFLNSLANRRVSAEDDPLQLLKCQELLQPGGTQATPIIGVPTKVVQQVSRGEVIPSSLPPSAVPVSQLISAAPNSVSQVVVPSSQLVTVSGGGVTMGGGGVTMGGGASSQMRALQNLPPNTRLVRGPNGQYTLQKIQTIELSADMQQVSLST